MTGIAAHLFATQLPDVQSASRAHAFVSAHFPHFAPPQSSSVSSPFFAPSVHVAVPPELVAPDDEELDVLDELVELEELVDPELEPDAPELEELDVSPL